MLKISKFFSICYVLIHAVMSGQDLKFNIPNNYVNPLGSKTDLISFNPLFKLNCNVIVNKTETKHIKRLPAHLQGVDLSYGFLFFKGNVASEFDSEITFLVKDYKSQEAEIYLDKNGNLDFIDDGLPITFNYEELIITLENESNKASAYHYKLGKSNVALNFASSIRNRFASKYPRANIIDANYWLTNQRLSVKLTHETLNGKPITILLNDASADGIFTFDTNDFGDRIVITEGQLDSNKDINSFLRWGEPIDKNAVFILYGKKYGVKYINQQGSFLEIEETSLRTGSKTRIGSKILDLNIELIDGTIVNLDDLLVDDKFLLLDFGGTWCGGCNIQQSTIKKVFETNKVNIVGIFEHDTKKSVTNYLKKHDIKWIVVLMNPELKTMFSVNVYPTYILIEPNKEVGLIDLESENILKYIVEK